MLPRATKHFHGAYGATWLFLKKSATSLNLKVQRNSEKSPGNLSPLTALNFPEPPIPKNKVSDPISDQEMAFARLVLSRAMTDRHAAKPSASTPTPPPSASRPPASPPSPGYLPLRLRLELPFPTKNTVELASREMARPAWVWSVPVLRLRQGVCYIFRSCDWPAEDILVVSGSTNRRSCASPGLFRGCGKMNGFCGNEIKSVPQGLKAG